MKLVTSALLGALFLLSCNSFKMIQESMEEPATTIEGFAEVEKCREKEAERKKRQRQQSGFLGLFTGAIDAGCGMDFDPDKDLFLLGVNSSNNMSLLSQDLEEQEDQDSQDLRLQSNQSARTEFIWAVGCAAASFVGSAAETIVDAAHEDENAAAQDCDRMLADLTLEKIDEMGKNMKKGFDEVKNKLNNMEGKMNRQHQETVRMFAGISRQIGQGNRKMQELIQEEVMEEMKALGKDTALLSSKLDQVSQKIEESMQLTEVATYKTLYARMAAAMAAVRGGFADIVSSVQDQQHHQVSLPHVHLDRNKMQSARTALQEWKEKEIVLMEKKHTVLQSSWGKARDSFIEIRAVLVEGDLLFEHFKIQLRTLAADHIDKLTSNQLQDFLVNYHLKAELHTAVEEDPLIKVILATVASATAVLEMYLAVFPNYDDVKEFSVSLHDMQKYIWDVHLRIRESEFLSSALLAPVLAKFAMDEECQRAAFRSGFKETENMVQWKNNWIALAPKVLKGSNDKAFFECKTRGNIASGITDHTFAAKTEYSCHRGEHLVGTHWKSLNYKSCGSDYKQTCVYMGFFNERCKDKTVELSVNCPTDYRISSMNIGSASYTCKSRTEEKSTEKKKWVQGGGGMHLHTYTEKTYFVWWTCTDKETGATVDINYLKTCALMPNAGTKTFEAKTRALSPYDPSSIQLHSTGSVLKLNSYVSQVYDRTNLILTYGPSCNSVEVGSHGMRVGRWFLQIGGHWRIRSDDAHLWIDSPTKCAYIFRHDHRVFSDGRKSRWTKGAPTMILKSVNMDIPEEYGIKFGWKFIQIGKWRIAEHDGESLSISHSNGNVAEFHHKDGTRTNPKGTSDAWTRPVGEAEGVFFGHAFIQIGAFRVGAYNWNHLTISHVKTGKLSVIYRGHDGTSHWGPRTDLTTVGRPVCLGHKDSV